MKLRAYVLHNVSTDIFFRFDPTTSKVGHAHTFEIEADDPLKAADLLWTLTNVTDSNDLRLSWPHLAQYASQVTTYRRRKNRSLSVGDVIVQYEGIHLRSVLAVATVGFEDLTSQVETNDRLLAVLKAGLSGASDELTASDAYIKSQELHNIFKL